MPPEPDNPVFLSEPKGLIGDEFFGISQLDIDLQTVSWLSNEDGLTWVGALGGTTPLLRHFFFFLVPFASVLRLIRGRRVVQHAGRFARSPASTHVDSGAFRWLISPCNAKGESGSSWHLVRWLRWLPAKKICRHSLSFSPHDRAFVIQKLSSEMLQPYKWMKLQTCLSRVRRQLSQCLRQTLCFWYDARAA